MQVQPQGSSSGARAPSDPRGHRTPRTPLLRTRPGSFACEAGKAGDPPRCLPRCPRRHGQVEKSSLECERSPLPAGGGLTCGVHIGFLQQPAMHALPMDGTGAPRSRGVESPYLRDARGREGAGWWRGGGEGGQRQIVWAGGVGRCSAGERDTP